MGIASGESRSPVDKKTISRSSLDASSLPPAPGVAPPLPVFLVSAFNQPESGLRAAVAPAHQARRWAAASGHQRDPEARKQLSWALVQGGSAGLPFQQVHCGAPTAVTRRGSQLSAP